MARLPEPPLAVSDMSANQLERRARLLDAVVELVLEGADEDMAMKDIADRAGVALGTVYRYFSSKDHLMAAALLEWAGELDARPARRPAAAISDGPVGPPADRLVAVLRQALRAYQLHPAFARILVFVANSDDPFASECYQQMGPVVYGTLGRSITDVDVDTRARIMKVVGAVWYHCLVEWTNGRMSVAEVHDMLESTARLLLPDKVRFATVPGGTHEESAV